MKRIKTLLKTIKYFRIGLSAYNFNDWKSEVYIWIAESKQITKGELK